ncbi:hypothetical protein CWT12_12265 [Actinomyces sp. 432]|uniref:hypothetical protein n=1 Tax=Actinomyces sp. 432 TaxID=2057798 RepID=UPI001373DCA5|nr:hypothetical protein [Actinomyces sp. 432]QHO91926.1 hypothetical protein CWT12_12265 [Actinomyces sp. 432]
MSAPPILTTADIAAASGGQVADGDPRIKVLLDAATEAARAWAGWHIAPVVEETMLLDGEGGQSLSLPTGRLLSAADLTVDGEVVDPALWDWSGAGMIRLRRGRFPDRFRAVQVAVRHGWETCPPLAGVVTAQVLAVLASPMGATREQAGQVSVTWGRSGLTMTGEDMQALAPYRLQNWA